MWIVHLVLKTWMFNVYVLKNLRTRLPKRLDALWIEEEYLIEPMADQLVGIKHSSLSYRNVPGHILPGSLPIAEGV